ncbi:hypothetical protein HDU98_001999 [Podochytrium sp. JEL0797]|nr:hypothetical protein HDU98_001999 [Podochytrium sp. JEL0797]
MTHEDVFHAQDSHKDTATRVIAIAIDNSRFSEYSFSWALEHLVRPTDQIVLINCRAIVSMPVVYGQVYVDLTKEADALEEACKQESHDLLNKFANKVAGGNYNMRGICLKGDPRDQICDKAAELKADILVVGARGLTGFKKAMLGSVSDYIIKHSKVPVVVCHAPEAEQ